MKDAQFYKEESHLWMWGTIAIIILVFFQDYVITLGYWSWLIIPGFMIVIIMGAFTTSGALKV